MKTILVLSIYLAAVIVSGQDTIYDESFDPSTLNEPEMEWPIVINPVSADSVRIEQAVGNAFSDLTRDGYRIQVLTTKIAAEADSLKQELSRVITDSTYITYDVPNYKVRVGDYINRREAEEMQTQIKGLGYRSAWIVRTKVDSD